VRVVQLRALVVPLVCIPVTQQTEMVWVVFGAPLLVMVMELPLVVHSMQPPEQVEPPVPVVP
jgi:hypothetical protein